MSKIQKSQTDSDASTKDLQDTSFIIVVKLPSSSKSSLENLSRNWP